MEERKMFELSDWNNPPTSVVITGATSGIGFATKKLLSRTGYEVYDISRTGLGKVDLSNRIQAENYLFNVFTFPKNCQILINNAGGMKIPETINDWDSLVTLNLHVPYILMWSFINTVPNRFPGLTAILPDPAINLCVINISSVSGLISEPECPIYAMTKAGLISLTRSWAKYGGKLKNKVRVNSISPGPICKTNLVEGETPDFLIEQTALLREGDPSEVAQLVLEIINNKFITGSNFVIDGGFTL